MDNQVSYFSSNIERILYQNRHYIDWDKTEFLKPLNMDFEGSIIIKNPQLLNMWHIQDSAH